ncbi:hypothetical protein T03_9562 [Trichinella britovi]|uniref:Uncharacterized protein n=1 Tax=Trichinella britovi TaxID=45882 RepID=A0A0V1D8L5_TRIBR|nr:hypothetical protein T03_9562 [Trichinella britovi]
MLQLSAKLSEPSWYGQPHAVVLADVIPHELVHTVDALPVFPDVFRQPMGLLLRRVLNLHVQRQPQLSAEHGDRRRHPRALVNAAVLRQHDKRQHVVSLVRVPIDYNGQHVEERAVKPFCLSIPLRVVRRVSCLPDAEQAVHLHHHRRFK